ncbi:MAG: hypothetical protein ABR497_06145, partial [Kiritimatiellia bacterium]
ARDKAHDKACVQRTQNTTIYSEKELKMQASWEYVSPLNSTRYPELSPTALAAPGINVYHHQLIQRIKSCRHLSVWPAP